MESQLVHQKLPIYLYYLSTIKMFSPETNLHMKINLVLSNVVVRVLDQSSAFSCRSQEISRV